MANTVILVTSLCCLLAVVSAMKFESFFPRSQTCGLSYGKILTKSPWVCEDSQFQEYPEARISPFLKYRSVNSYLGVTDSCYNYHDSEFKGENEQYQYDSVCAINRKPINVIWAHVPNYQTPPELLHLNDGKLPVHVVRGQRLFDVECVHPFARAADIEAAKQTSAKPRRTGLSGIQLNGAKRHLCYLGYVYMRNHVCQPTGFITQDVLVYSPHANRMFLTRVTDIPTSCACTYCECGPPKPWGGF